MPLGHLGINVPDLPAAKAYFDELMPLLGYAEFFARSDEFSYRPVDDKPGTYLFFYPSEEPGDYSHRAPGLQHLAFIVRTREAVDAVHGQVTGTGGDVVHPPRDFPEYGPPYYATFWRSPFGHLLEAVCHRA